MITSSLEQVLNRRWQRIPTGSLAQPRLVSRSPAAPRQKSPAHNRSPAIGIWIIAFDAQRRPQNIGHTSAEKPATHAHATLVGTASRISLVQVQKANKHRPGYALESIERNTTFETQTLSAYRPFMPSVIDREPLSLVTR